MQAEIEEFRQVLTIHSPHANKFHELGDDGEPLCGETSKHDWARVPVWLAEQRWNDPCQRENCRDARDD